MDDIQIILVCRRCGREPRWDNMIQVDPTHLVPRDFVTEDEWCSLCMGPFSTRENTDSPVTP